MGWERATTLVSSKRKLVEGGIYPKCENLRIAVKGCSMLGIFPSEFMFPENKKIRSAYYLYSNIILVYWVGFIVTQYIQLFLILNENPIKTDLMSLNLCITLLYTVTISKKLIILISPSFKKIIEAIIEDEVNKDPIDDELNIENVNWQYRIYIYNVFIVCLLYFLKPIMVGTIEETYGNVTRIMAYIFQYIDALVGANSVMVIDILMISLILYLCRQLRKLDDLFRNFKDFKRKYQTLNAIEDEELAGFLFFKHLIVRHENIIQYVNTYNKNMAYPMVLDFI
ncbi:uncharacterized protein [Euwallacea similis]|uniref:uncharacterized protein n=1 Tax=Euwallacea similis TaxID=1736056 RepID=UPI00344D0465